MFAHLSKIMEIKLDGTLQDSSSLNHRLRRPEPIKTLVFYYRSISRLRGNRGPMSESVTIPVMKKHDISLFTSHTSPLI